MEIVQYAVHKQPSVAWVSVNFDRLRVHTGPLSFLGLFRSGARLRTLSCLVLIDNLIQPVLGGHNGMMQIYQADALSWGLMQRGRFESVSSLLAFPGGIAMPFLMRKVGLAWTARIGIASTGVGLLAFYLARTSLHFYGAALLGTLGRGASMSLSPALSAMIAAEVRLFGHVLKSSSGFIE